MLKLPDKHQILVVDDEPDVHSLTKLALKGMNYKGKDIKIFKAMTGKEALDIMSENPYVAVILLDVIMESSSAGLDACRTIREELKNPFVRILLRTGQPGSAPERKVIDEYDIDGYLQKEELTSNRLYSSTRTAIKAFDEIIELYRHREVLSIINRSVMLLHSFDPLDITLHHILQTALKITLAPLGVLYLETFESENSHRNHLIKISEEMDENEVEESVKSIVNIVNDDFSLHSLQEPFQLENGLFIPLTIHKNLGFGWIYLKGEITDKLILESLPFLVSHASNALYSTISQEIISVR